jgi:hypothetical protein
MTESTMNRLAEAAQGLGIECNTYPDYRGRGMYGRTTCGVVVSNTADFAVICAAAGRSVPEAEVSDFLAEIRNVRTDSLGLDIIVY